MSKTDKRSLGALLLHGGDWRGIRVMGLGERLVDIGVSAVASLLCLYAAGYFPSRSEMRSDPGRHDGDDNRRGGGRENRVEALQEPAAHAALPPVERGVSGGSDAGADEDGLILPEGVRLPPLDQPALLQNPGGLGIGPAKLDIAGSGVDPFENSVVPYVHADNSTTNRAEGAATPTTNH